METKVKLNMVNYIFIKHTFEIE